MFFCALVGPRFPLLPRPASSTCPSCVSACSAVVFFVPIFALSAAAARPACAPCSSPCYPCPAAPRLLTRPSPLPFSFSQANLPVHLPSLSEPRCHSCVPPSCPTPAPLRRPYPFPWGLPHPSVPSVPVSHPILVALCPVRGGGGVSADWTVAPPEDWHGRWVPTHHEPPHLPKEHTRTTVRHLSNSLRCICTVELRRRDQLRRCCTGLFQSDLSPQSDPAWSPKAHTPLHIAGVPWRRRPPRPGMVNPSEQGTRKSNVFNAAPSCLAEGFAAM